MKNISHDIRTHHTAIAQAIVRTSVPGITGALMDNKLQDGNARETSRVAGLLAIKNTGGVIPGCHGVQVEFASIQYRTEGPDIIITVEVQAIAKTGLAVESLHGASVAALALYDALHSHDRGIEIISIKLLSEIGGKEQYNDKLGRSVRTAVVVCSDSISAGTKQDFSGKAIMSRIERYDVVVEDYCVIPDEVSAIREKVQALCNNKTDLVILTGGTGLTERDITPEAIRPMLDREIPGIAEAARAYGQEHMPYSMLSRSLAGLKGSTLILALPGSTRGAAESMDALFPYLLHYFRVMENPPHD